MFLEAIMVCVDYSDFLEISLPQNQKHFDHIVVITSKNDTKTQQICKDYGVTCCITERMHEDNAKFNKGKAINEGVKLLKKKDWVLITDADMVMPDDFKDHLISQPLDKKCIYGTPRYLCPDLKNWIEYAANKDIHKNWKFEGKVVNLGVGFFQLFNSESGVIKDTDKWYSEKWGHCGRSDRKFLRLWNPEQRKALLEMHVIHLGDDKVGANWEGRTTPKFS